MIVTIHDPIAIQNSVHDQKMCIDEISAAKTGAVAGHKVGAIERCGVILSRFSV